MEGTPLDGDVCYTALLARDPRFDGRFFVGVASTGVFCRPVCPARTPHRENCTFYRCAAAAQDAGFRPCLRCRPETAPGTPAWQGTHATVARALRLIEDGALDHAATDALAARLGVGERHLRRLFEQHLGASPAAVARTRRLLFARTLLTTTELPVSQVALAAGFGSLRRFNASFREVYGVTPRALRSRARGTRAEALELRLSYRPPFDWEALLAFLDLRAIPGVEQVDLEAGTYTRTIALGDAVGWLEARHDPARGKLVANVHLSDPAPAIRVAERLGRLFDLGCEPDAIESHLENDPLLRGVLRKRPGLRLPGAFCGFELAVRVVLGQQVSVRGASTIAGRLVAAHGEPIDDEGLAVRLGGRTPRAFPKPEVLASADLTGIGMPGARGRAVCALARAVVDGRLDLEGGADPAEARAALEALPGLGPWTASVIAMRALGEPDAFPESDLGLLRAAAGSGERLTPAALRKRAESWRPWRAYAAIALWGSESA